MKRIAAVATLIVLLVTGSACGKKAQFDSSGSSAGVEPKSQRLGGPDTVAQYDASVSSGKAQGLSRDEAAPGAPAQSAPLPPLPVPGLPSKVVKTASVEVKVSEGRFQIQFSKANVLAESLGGFVSNSNVSETSGKIASGTLTIRVPANKFQTAVARLKALGKVTAEEQSGQDVTREFIDLEARLRHARAQEAFFLKLLDQSKTIADLVQVQQQLANIQLQIEQLQGQLQFLKDQTDFSTITARIYEPGAKPGPVKGLGKAWREAIDAFQSVLAWVIVAGGTVVPLGLLALIAVFAYRSIRRSRKDTPKSG